MTRLGVFGGSFNPPHNAHLLVARGALEQFELDEVLWIPALIPPHKQDERLAAAEHRLRMTKLFAAGDDRFRVSDLELRRDGPSYTVDTLERLHSLHPDAALYLIVGEDSLRQFHLWRAPGRILDRIEQILVYRREATTELPEVSQMVEDRYWVIDGDTIDLSSTELRSDLAAGADVSERVPRPVYDYIREHGLYLGG